MPNANLGLAAAGGNFPRRFTGMRPCVPDDFGLYGEGTQGDAAVPGAVEESNKDRINAHPVPEFPPG
jgi:hypothetical protein